MHKIPLTPLEESGLSAHRLPIGKPSQLSDAFRHGVAWAQNSMAKPVNVPFAQVLPLPNDSGTVTFTAVAGQALGTTCEGMKNLNLIPRAPLGE